MGKVVASEDIPAATQLFTPNWIVKYLVQNTLGRQWVATYPQSSLRQPDQMPYYIEPTEQTLEVQEQLRAIIPDSLNPEKLTLLDPACGSGHILVEAYDLFKTIYLERGYRAKEIPALILQKNLFGLEIDDRAAQLATFALMMKARADDRRIFFSQVKPNILAFQGSLGMDAAAITHALNSPINKEQTPPSEFLFDEIENEATPLFSKKIQGEKGHVSQGDIASLLALFESAKTFGSLLKVPPKLAAKLPEIEDRLKEVMKHGDLTQAPALILKSVLQQARLLANQYNVVVANPPYLGMRAMNAEIRAFTQVHYPEYKLDTYAAFIARSLSFTQSGCTAGLVTMHSWMFLHRFENMRQDILKKCTIYSLAHLGSRAFSTLSGEVVQACAFVISPNYTRHFIPSFLRCVDGDEDDKNKALVAKRNLFCRFEQESFLAIEGGILANWVSNQVMRLFHEFPHADAFASPRHGMVTSDNDRFLRHWWEVPHDRIGFGMKTRQDAAESRKKWFPYNKGGSYRKWYGNVGLVINWENDGEAVIGYAKELYGSPSRKIQAQEFYFQSGVTWSALTGGDVSMRANGPGFLFDSKGSSMFCNDENSLYALMSVFNSVVASHLLNVMAPTLDFSAGAMANMPVPSELIHQRKNELADLARECRSIAKADWDSSETSWDFKSLPITGFSNEGVLSNSFSALQQSCATYREQSKKAEENINRELLSAYGLSSELSAEIREDQISLFVPSREEDIRRLISYAIACMMGRYSLDKPGLIYAHGGNQDFDSSQFKTFRADDDGIIPLIESDWGIRDDATERIVEFVGLAWPKHYLEENLKFIADSLVSTKNEQPRDTIRRYLATGFYKHHLSMYKKRPIYWLFSSGKQRAFQCLVYLHRYHEGTLARMRTEYVIPLQGKLAGRIEQLEGDKFKAASTSHRKKLQKEQDDLKKQQAELSTFEEKLKHAADQKISLDLDDGVKVNYAKFGDLLAEAKAITGGRDEE